MPKVYDKVKQTVAEQGKLQQFQLHSNLEISIIKKSTKFYMSISKCQLVGLTFTHYYLAVND